MSSAIISGCGKLNTNGGGESNLLYLNMIYIPVDGSTARTRFEFFSKQSVNNINDFLDVLYFYESYNQPIILIGGDYVTKNSSSTTYNRYAVVDLFKSTSNYVNLSYRKTSTNVDDTIKLFKIDGTKPTNWIFANIKLQ